MRRCVGKRASFPEGTDEVARNVACERGGAGYRDWLATGLVAYRKQLPSLR